ncbi:hypothetical protein DQ04_02481000 [Trypanosoma grayi]|uniref:hypothetical protein n=1 Tax=Trypanosoma grayi TaxID=71804 RepID=UPI0004F4A563|nr:hypothetical protein DQ04_02481000 [Trypanosoma grayi]KEG11565.1 hypothetical protein DQ04_02481000 [Trypanosoma grayi]
MSKAGEGGNTSLARVGSVASATRPISGLSFLDESKLHPDFRRLKGNQMYFVDRCVYFERNGMSGENRIIALTPTAFFVLDFNGTMDRGTAYEQVGDIYQKKAKGKLLSFIASENHLLLKVPSEIDCHVCFLNPGTLHKCTEVLQRVLGAQRGVAVAVKDVPPEKGIEFYCNDKRPEGYYTLREVAEVMRQRSILETYISEGQRQVMALLQEIEVAKQQVASREEEVEALKKKGIDEKSIRRRKASVEEKQMQLHQKVSAKQEENERVLERVRTLKDDLEAARNNMGALVEEGIAAVMAKVSKQDDETVALRRRVQQKERVAAEEEIMKYKRELFAAHGGGNAATRALEAKVSTAFAELEKELEEVFRLEKFITTVNGEIRVHSDQIASLNSEKQGLINAREKKAVPSPTKPAPGNGLDELDDLLLAAPVNNLLNSPPLPPSAAASAVTAASGDPLSAALLEEDLL